MILDFRTVIRGRGLILCKKKDRTQEKVKISSTKPTRGEKGDLYYFLILRFGSSERALKDSFGEKKRECFVENARHSS